MQIDNKFLQQICDTIRDNDNFCNVNTLYIALFDIHNMGVTKLAGHLDFLEDEELIEVLRNYSLPFNHEDENVIVRLTSKGYGLCSCIK